MLVRVVLPGVLADDAGGRRELEVDLAGGVSVAALLDALALKHPRLERRVRDETGALRRHVNVYVGEDDVRGCGGVGAVIPPGVVVSVLPSVAGG